MQIFGASKKMTVDRVCEACKNIIEDEDDDVLACGHHAHADCLIERCNGDVPQIRCPRCEALLFGPVVHGLHLQILIPYYFMINILGAIHALVPFLVAFILIEPYYLYNKYFTSV